MIRRTLLALSAVMVLAGWGSCTRAKTLVGSIAGTACERAGEELRAYETQRESYANLCKARGTQPVRAPFWACYEDASRALCRDVTGREEWDCRYAVRHECNAAVHALEVIGKCPNSTWPLPQGNTSCEEMLEFGRREDPPQRPMCQCCSELPLELRQGSRCCK